MAICKRLFIGLELPAACRSALVDLNPNIRNLRWLPAEQLHLTLSFIGPVAPELEGSLIAALSQVRIPRFFLPLQGLGTFASRGRDSVVWVGVGKGHPHLFALHHHVQDAVLKAGLAPDLRPFHPHVTVGRAHGLSTGTIQPLLKKYRDTEFGFFEAQSFVVFCSHLAPEGATYTVEHRVELLAH